MASLLAETLRSHAFDVATAGSVQEAREQIDAFDPDMLLLDISLGNGPTGVHLAHALQVTRPDIAILVLTRHPDAASASAEGLTLPDNVGYLRKHMVSDSSYLLDAIEKVFAERSTEVRHDAVEGGRLDGLGEQALRVLRGVALGHSNARIAADCDLSVKSVERWLEVIYRELNLDRSQEMNLRVQAAREYYAAVGMPTRSES